MLDGKVRCLETRVTENGFIRRRYLMDDGSRRTTYEIPASVFSAQSKRSRAEHAEVAARVADAQSGRAARTRLVLKLAGDGLSHEKIAAECSCSSKTVSRILREYREQQQKVLAQTNTCAMIG